MQPAMTHRERVLAALQGRDFDRVPVSMWRHFYGQETSGEGLVQAMLSYQRRFDWDFLKLNPRASYHVEDWGVRVENKGDQAPVVGSRPIGVPADWSRIRPLDVNSGVLGEHLKALERVARGVGRDVPVLMTVFTPLSIAGRLAVSEEAFLAHLRESWQQVQPALEAITSTFSRFCAACLERGAAGIFLATTAWASRKRLTEEEYATLARPWDLKLLATLPPAEFHVLHVCREYNMLDLLADYPVHAFNWDMFGQENPSLVEGRRLLAKKAVIGGLPHGDRLVGETPRGLRERVLALKAAMGKRRWMLGPGCTYAPETEQENVAAVRQAADA